MATENKTEDRKHSIAKEPYKNTKKINAVTKDKKLGEKT